MAICKKCEGRGWNYNEIYYDTKHKYPNSDAYMQYNPTKKCGKCKGTGFIIGNVSEVLDFLKFLEGKIERKEFLSGKEIIDQVKQCISVIET